MKTFPEVGDEVEVLLDDRLPDGDDLMTCPRCGKPATAENFFGPCSSCRAELRDRALQQRVWRWLLGWLTPGWGPKEEEIAPEVWDQMARRERAAREKRRARR